MIWEGVEKSERCIRTHHIAFVGITAVALTSVWPHSSKTGRWEMFKLGRDPPLRWINKCSKYQVPDYTASEFINKLR